MEVLQSLGVNSSIGIQFIVFLVAYVVLSNVWFKPYLAAFEKRKEQTEGQESLAEELDVRTQDLHLQFDSKQRELNQKIQSIFAAAKKRGTDEANEILDQAKTESENFLANASQRVAHDIDVAKKDFQRLVPEISQAVVEKLVGRNI